MDIKKKILIKSQGDDFYEQEFDTEESAYNFLQEVLDNTNSGKWNETEFIFDVEDDLITWFENNKPIQYVAGWHWMEEQDKKQIIMPNGKSFYEQINY